MRNPALARNTGRMSRDRTSRRRAPTAGQTRSLSVRARIVVSILAVTALGLAGAGTASFLVQRDRALSIIDEELLRAVDDLKVVAATETADEAATGEPVTVDSLLRAAMQQIIPDSGESVLGLIDGKAALVPAAALPFRLDDDADLVNRLASERDATNVVRGTATGPLGSIRYIIIPVSVAEDDSAGAYVAAYNLDDELGEVAGSFRSYAVVAIIALALVGAVAWLVAGRLLRPIRLLRHAAAANSAADLSERIPVTGHDDVSELTTTVNDMFARLETSFESQRRLIDDVGHELMTPITIIRGHLELLEAASPADVDATRSLAISELDRMGTLVEEISLLAESDGARFVEPEEVDIALLTALVADKARALDPGREWRVESRADGPALLDQRRITQGWLQLAANAAKYSSAGTIITMASEETASRHGRWLELSVRDEGPGIPAAAQKRVFERFGRLESSRGTEGSGLGLAIVSAIAAAHGGTVILSSTPADGSTFTIRIPLIDDTSETGAETRV